MTKKAVLIAPFLLLFLNAYSQSESDTLIQRFTNDMRRLVELNSHTPNVTDFSLKEAVDIQTNANVDQIIEITKPYLNSEVLNTKNVCYGLLADALYKKVKDQNQKEQILELLCQYYLKTSLDIQLVDIILLRLKEKDFNSNAKKYITALKDSLSKPGCHLPVDICAQILAVAQIKESIPLLWKKVNKNISNIQRFDVDILASLARMNEKEAGILLCDFYSSKVSRADSTYRYIIYSTNLSFSLDSSVLNCLIRDYKNIDLKYYYHSYDSGFYPAQYLGFNIASMLKDYPYPKEDYTLKTQQLFDWLSQTKNYELEEK